MRNLNLLLWNVEGLKHLKAATQEIFWNNFDVGITTETFLTEPLIFPNFYSVHALAKPKERGRPEGGVTCIYKDILGKIKEKHIEENTVILKTERVAIIGLYISPAQGIDDAIEQIIKAISWVKNEENVILAGDLNCRIDKPNHKTELVLELLQEEGFTLINNAKDVTYIAPNGTSTIDLVWYRGHSIKVCKQQIMYSIADAPMRKHLPVATNFQWPEEWEHKKNWTVPLRASRRLNEEILQKQTPLLEKAKEQLDRNQLDEALESIAIYIQGAQVPQQQRKAKPWFDYVCYNLRRETLNLLNKAKQERSPQALLIYSAKRREYKTMIRTKKETYIEEQARNQAEEAEKNPFIAVRKKSAVSASSMQIETWEQHFTTLLNKDRIKSAYDNVQDGSNHLDNPITLKEVQKAIQNTKNKKATGPDGIFNENLKETSCILDVLWTQLFNKCLTLGTLPHSWRTSHIKILYKGKGALDDPNSYRGIALEQNPYKLFSSIINLRLRQAIDHLIPEEQFGFRKGRGTLQAVGVLLDDIQEKLKYRRGKYMAVFIDYAKAFDSVHRATLMQKLEAMTGKNNGITKTIRNTLSANHITINDGVSTSKPITQTNGVLQGDPLSPTLFNVATSDINRITYQLEVSLLMYADDMILGSSNKSDLQTAVNRLQEWAKENKFSVNKNKTVMMVFRRGGRIAAEDNIIMDGEEIQKVNSFKYLGITLQTTARSFRIHVREKVAAAIRNMYDITNPTQLSLSTAMLLFRTKILPVITYGLELIWEQLTVSDMKVIENTKARFLKRVLGVSKMTPSRLTYELARETFLIEDIRINMQLPHTPQEADLLRIRREKRAEIWWDFYATDAMVDRRWTGPNRELRSAMARLAVHGFHHRFCRKVYFHDPDEDCVCKFCDKHCERYHFKRCAIYTKSLIELSKEN